MSSLVLTVNSSTLNLGFFSPIASGEANTVANVGAGAEVFRNQVAETFNLRSITGIEGIDAAVNGDIVEIDGNRDTAQWNASKLQGENLSATPPNDREHMVYNGIANQWEPSTDGAGDILGPGVAVNANAPLVWNGTTGKNAKEPDAAVDYLGQAITNVGNVDGRDVSVDGGALDTHLIDTANPHATDIGNLGSGTLAELNAKIIDATLDDSGDSRTPIAHATTHLEGGSDPLVVPPSDMIFGANSIFATTTTRYLFPGFADSGAQTGVIQRVITRSGVLRNLFVLQNGPAGNGNNVAYTVRKNGVPTSLAVTMASTDSVNSDTSNSVSVIAGDLIDIEVTKALSVGSAPNDVIAALECTV